MRCSILLVYGALIPAVVRSEPSGDAALQAMVTEHCAKCHGEKKQKGGVDFRGFLGGELPLKKFKLWKEVLAQVRSDQMPPDDDAHWDDAAKQKLLEHLQATLAPLENDDPATLDPGPALIRRLSRSEYQNALRDLLGWETDVLKNAGISEDSTGSAFDNVAVALMIQPTLLEKYFAAADQVLTDMFPEPGALVADDYETKNRVQRAQAAAARMLHDVSADRVGAEQLLPKFARRAWRRPVAENETARLLQLFDASVSRGDSFPVALRKALKPVLVSPSFLFRSEDAVEPGTLASKGAPVSSFELATRLSFFLWSSIPDEPLLSAAERNELADPAALAAQVQRMLADPRAAALTENFFMKWLEIDRLATARPSTEFFPTFNDVLKRSMRAEVETFCNRLRTEDHSVLDLLNADYTYCDATLSKHYGLADPGNKEPQRVALRAEDQRGGVLGMGSVLALTSHTSRTSPTLRGKYVLDVLFGTPPAPPPANVSQIDEKKKTPDGHEPRNFREKLALHAQDATCAGCHKKIDPLGFGLENYDAIGAWRPSSAELDASGQLPGGKKFNGAGELREILWTRRGDFERNLIAQMLRYALGRELEWFDERSITRIQQALQKDGHKFSVLVQGIVSSYPFQNRRDAEPAPTTASNP